jgi:hypothetical protein
VLIDTAVARELAALAGCRNIHWASSLAELPAAIERALGEDLCSERPPIRTWRETALEYATAIKQLLSQDIDVKRLRARWDCLRTMQSREADQ